MTDLNRFVSFEGIDYAGKSTQIELLKNRLQEHREQVYVLREPGGTVISERIREILLDRKHLEMTREAELLLYSAARNQLVKEKIIPLLEQGNFIIADRYVDSTTAYQGYGRKIDLEIIGHINLLATAGLLPSITIFLDLAAEEIENRRQSRNRSRDRMEQSGTDFYKIIREGYFKIAEKDKRRFKVINASKNVMEIHEEVWELIKNKFNFNS